MERLEEKLMALASAHEATGFVTALGGMEVKRLYFCYIVVLETY